MEAELVKVVSELRARANELDGLMTARSTRPPAPPGFITFQVGSCAVDYKGWCGPALSLLTHSLT